MTLHELADKLFEIRCDVRSRPEYVKEQLTKPVTQSRAVKTPFAKRFDQIVANIAVGLDHILCDPEILEGYLYGAAAEIRELAEREERGA